jgi:hypothetical protein
MWVGLDQRTKWIAPVMHSASALSVVRSSAFEKAVADPSNTQPETNKVLYEAFRAHVKLKQGANALHADVA